MDNKEITFNFEYIEQFSQLYDSWLNYIYDYSKATSIVSAKLAHEIKNPLTLMKTTLQLIEYHHQEVKTHKYWGSLYDNINHICNILNDYNTINTCEDINYEPINICELFQYVKTIFEPTAIKKNISFEIDIPEEIIKINGNRERLYEAFINIIKNAFEATPEKGCVKVTSYMEDSNIQIVIQDNGCGIANENMDKIFCHFVTFKENGTGLGLPIVKSIIEEHLGTIIVDSEQNIGTTFTVKLPVIEHVNRQVV
jgi:signal transduction histidine kinase